MAYISYYTTKPARKPVTYVTDQGNCIGVALGIGLADYDITMRTQENACPNSFKVNVELGSYGSTESPRSSRPQPLTLAPF